MFKSAVALAIGLRVGIALLTCTYFQPDEYFQSLEVAHHAVFGYGQLTWEWLAPKPIRSIIYPGLNVPIYWLLKSLHLDHTYALIWGPKMLHGVIAAGTDIYAFRLAKRLVGERYAGAALYMSLTSVFHALSLSRSMSNSAETTLTTMAMAYFPWDVALPSWKKELRITLWLAATACAIRPTNAIIWVYMYAWLLLSLRKRPLDILFVLVNAFAVGLVTLFATFVLDSYYYGKPAFTPLDFLLTNASSVSLFYGQSPWHYYLTQALPILLGGPPILYFLQGAYRTATDRYCPRSHRVLLQVIVWAIAVYSLAGHKEWRFLHPLLPLMHVLAAKPAVHFWTDLSGLRQLIGSSPSPPPPPPSVSHTRMKPRDFFFPTVTLLVIAYVMRWHERGQVEVMYYLRSLPAEQTSSIGILMPCHSTPWQAYLHRADLANDGQLWALGCEPPLQGQNLSTYVDQTALFYRSPIRYLTTRFPQRVDPSFPPSPLPRSRPGEVAESGEPHPWRHEWPQNLVFFGSLLEQEGVEDYLRKLGYAAVWTHWAGWLSEGHRKGEVQVWRYQFENA